MLLDVRTYKTLPGRVPAQLELYKKLGYPVQLRYMGEPLCYAVAESGELNTFTHVWVYESAADRETKRGTSDPTYLYYTLGKLQIMKLREDYKKKLGAKYTLAAFHDAFVQQGFPPIKIVRRALLGDDSPTL